MGPTIIITSPQDKPTWGMLSSGFSGESPLFILLEHRVFRELLVVFFEIAGDVRAIVAGEV